MMDLLFRAQSTSLESQRSAFVPQSLERRSTKGSDSEAVRAVARFGGWVGRVAPSLTLRRRREGAALGVAPRHGQEADRGALQRRHAAQARDDRHSHSAAAAAL